MGRIIGLIPSFVLVTLMVLAVHAADDLPQGFMPLFNGQNLTGWKVPKGDNDHWKVVDGVIDYDARSEAKGDKCLWSEKSYGDLVLRLDWKLKLEPAFKNKN